MPALSPLDEASLVLAVGAAGGLVAAGLFALVRRRSPAAGGLESPATGDLRPLTAVQRAGSYAVLALALLVAARTGLPGLSVLVGLLGALGLLEWSRLFDLPIHHRVGLLVADVVIIGAVAIGGIASAGVLVGGLVLVGVLWPVIRADTGRAIRDLGMAAVGCLMIPVLLAHGVALQFELGEAGAVLFVALAVACAGSDVGAFVIGRRFGKTPLAPRLSPNKTRAGVVGNVLGAGIGLALFVPALLPTFGVPFTLMLVPLVAAGSVWGDLLESAVKREAHVKDAGSLLPGFGGILDRIDSLLVTVALAYWATHIAGFA